MISDELREFAYLHFSGIENIGPCDALMSIADRIDAEMVELPRDADGKTIHVGETIYGLRGRGRMVVSLRLYGEEDPTWMVSIGTDECVHPSRITHERPDSLERIADELEEWIDGADVDGDACEKPRDLAKRIRKLAERECEQCH